MRSWIALFAVTATLGITSPAIAQEVRAAERRARSVSVGVNDGVEFGYWNRISRRADVGLNLGFSVETLGDDTGDQKLRTFSLEPALKLYAAPDGAFLPYGYASVFGSYGRLSATGTGGGNDGSATVRNDQREYGASLGLGLDWFPARRISLGAHVGVAGGYRSQELSGPFDDQKQDGVFLNTLSSGLRVHLYF